jgi:hypothetical protein
MASISYTPATSSQLQPAIEFLRKNTSYYKVIEDTYKFDEKLDGKDGKSELEEFLYASMASSGKSKQASLDGYYFLQRCLLINNNPSGYYRTESTLSDSIKTTHGISGLELEEVRIKAYYDHSLENNEYARKLLKEGREDLVECIARAYVTNSKNDKNIVLNKTKEIVSQVPIPTGTLKDFIRLTGLLVDVELSTAIEKVVKKAANNDPSFKEVTIASAN